MKIVCVVKTTAYEWYRKSDIRKSQFSSLDEFRRDNIRKSHERQLDLLNHLKNLTKQFGLNTDFVQDTAIKTIDPKKYELIMTCGGDGTFLSAAQQFNDHLLLGINSDFNNHPEKGSVGFLTTVNEHNLVSALKSIKNKTYKVEKWQRLYAKINGKKLKELAVNDIYFGPVESYATAHFLIQWNKTIEKFSACSGLICCTGMGSNAWAKHAQGTPFENRLNIYGFVVRDPDVRRNHRFTKGIIPGDEELIIKPDRSGYVISFDSKKHNYKLDISDELRIGLAKDNQVQVLKF